MLHFHSSVSTVFKPGCTLALLVSLKQADRQRKSYALFPIKPFSLGVRPGHMYFQKSPTDDRQMQPQG